MDLIGSKTRKFFLIPSFNIKLFFPL